MRFVSPRISVCSVMFRVCFCIHVVGISLVFSNVDISPTYTWMFYYMEMCALARNVAQSTQVLNLQVRLSLSQKPEGSHGAPVTLFLLYNLRNTV